MSYAEDLLGPLHKDWSPTPAVGPQVIPPDPPRRERGASNIVMVGLGKHQLRSRGAGFTQQIGAMAQAHGKMPRVVIHASNWDRTKESAALMQEQMAMMGIKPEMNIVPELAPQSLGELEGQESSKVKDEVNRYRTEFRDVPFPGISPMTGQKGESTDHYAGRILPFIDKLVKDSAEHPSTIHIVAAHSSDMNEIRRKYDPSYSGTHETIEPARTDLIHFGDGGTPKYVMDVTIGGNRKIIPGVYLQHHGATEFNIERPELRGAIAQILPQERRETASTNPSNGGTPSGTPPPTGQY